MEKLMVLNFFITYIGSGCITLHLHPQTTFQTVEGFGGAVTDAAGINWKNLSDPVQKSLIDSYFSDNGLQYNMIRVPIGGTDFSTHPYAYNELPVNDAKLTNYSLTYEDFQYKIPMIKSAMQASSSPVHVIATTWSPPPWMKSNNAYTGHSRLKTEYYQTYADYHLKFLEKYTTEGIPIWAITTTNEPTSGMVGFINNINNLGWTAGSMGSWIVNNLGPTIRNSTFKDIKIITGDDQRLTLPYWVNLLIAEHPKVLDYIDGIGVHYYTDFITPAVVISEVGKLYPTKFIIATEACEGTMLFEKHHVDLGSWTRAKKYVIDIIDDFNHGVVGWVDWNMCLNIQGGPTYISNFADSPIIVFPRTNAFAKQPMFYAMGHFSKFVPRGSQRISVTHKLSCRNSVWKVAFITPKNTVVVVLYNDHSKPTKVIIQLGGNQAVVEMEANSVATVEMMRSGCITLHLHPQTTFQTVEGFGGAVTDAAGINWKNLSDPVQKSLIDSYFSDNGLQYNMIRVPIGGTDFSTHPYAYNELPVNDAKLTNYSLTYEDFQYKIPMIKSAMQASSSPVHVIATTWSPPPWMKSNNAYTGHSRLKTEYYQTYADYHLKFLEKYTTEGIPIWAITTTNEPTSGMVGFINNINNLGWTAGSMGSWIVNNLGPTIRNSTFKDIKIITGDDQRLTLPYWVNLLIAEHPKVLDYIDGIGVHYYTDFITPAVVISEVGKLYPTKFIIATEACEGTMLFEKHHVDLGSWTRAKKYVIDIIDDFNHGVVGWVDWNMCLNIQGGPTYISNFADSPIIVFPRTNAFAKQPMFYAMGHFSKFVPRGSQRISVTHKLSCRNSVWKVAFITPKNTVVVVLYNDHSKPTKVIIQLGGNQAVVEMEANSVATVEMMSN